ncbi:MAG: Ig-like domain-containing protein [Acidobacteriota bacterium]
MRARSRSFVSILLFALLVGAIFAACDSADNPVAPTGSVLTLTASPTLIDLTGQAATIVVSGFRPDGNSLNPGTQITLTTSLGVLRSAPVPEAPATNVLEVDDQGRAFAYLFGDGRSGTATLTASLTTGGDTMATADVQIGRDDASRPSVVVDANPSAVQVGQASGITITARQSDGSPLAGAEVNVRTNLGTLSPSSGIVTNSAGVATTTLRSNQSGTATVTASVGSSEEMSATVEIGTTTRPTVTLNVNPRTLDIGEFAEVTAIARTGTGDALPSGSTILIEAEGGTLHAVRDVNSSTIDRVRTDSTGRATFFFLAGDNAGQAQVAAIVGNSDRATTTLNIRDSPAALVFRTSSNTVDNDGDMLTLTAQVFNSDGDALAGETVIFTLSSGVSGTFAPPNGTQQTDTNGQAVVTVTFDNNDLPPAGSTFTVTATVASLSQTETVTVE